ncbi:zinc ribbon domain-containing protein [Nonomuraea sp. SYSU D8015]|uniref:zinc ribbon domain-containing protein n=1 Tax=Nonomuraea sp. SYSU D8015 TaxID=2593644 RepID=UPI0016610EE5|nr:zinc ribbon domain-containing protein [Nonomuraea sp. SYSU D8015]
MATLTACPKCRTAVPPQQSACLRCGQSVDAVVQACAACESRNDQDARFCARCGHSLAVPVARPSMPAVPVDTTNVFVDYRSHRVPVLIGLAVFLVLAVLVSGLKVVESSFFRPESTVARFFDALRDRDAALARSLLVPTDDIDNPVLLQSKVLKSSGYIPPADVRVEEAQKTESESEDDEVTVRASFTLDQERRSVTLRLRRDEQRVAGVFHRWRIKGGVYQITAHASGAESLLVAGEVVPVNRSYVMLDAYPGGYRVSLPDQPLWEANPVVAYAGTDVAGYAVDEVSLEPVIKSSARAAIDQQVRSYVDNCAKSTLLAPENCPFSAASWYEVRNVRWKIVTYPEYVVERGYSGEVTLSSTEYGEASVTGREVYGFSSGSQPYEETTRFYVSGSVVVLEGAVTFVPEQR